MVHLRWWNSRCLCMQVGVGGARQMKRPWPSPVSHTCAHPTGPLDTYPVVPPLENELLCQWREGGGVRQTDSCVLRNP